MAQKKYTDGSGVSEIWLNIKNYVYSQLLGKADASHTHTKSQITDLDLSNYVDKTSNQTVAGNKEFTGTTTAHDLVPSATDTYNLGSSSYQWNNAYIKSLTINGVVCGDILTHNVSEFVKVTGNQTIGGTKTFTASPRVTKTSPDIALNISDCDVTELPTESKYASLYFRDKNNKILAYITGQQRTNGQKRMCLRTHRTDNINNYYSVDLDSEGDFYPEQNNGMNLGTSACKWKSVYSNSYYLGTTAFGDIVTHNASEFVHANDLATVATSGSYNDLSDKPNPYTPPTFTYDSSTETLTISNTTATVFNYDSNTETLEIQING